MRVETYFVVLEMRNYSKYVINCMWETYNLPVTSGKISADVDELWTYSSAMHTYIQIQENTMLFIGVLNLRTNPVALQWFIDHGL